MKRDTIEIYYYEKGDYVRSTNGVAVVLDDERKIKNIDQLTYNDIRIQHKNSYRENIQNIPVEVNRKYLVIINKFEYDKERKISVGEFCKNMVEADNAMEREGRKLFC